MLGKRVSITTFALVFLALTTAFAAGEKHKKALAAQPGTQKLRTLPSPPTARAATRAECSAA